MSKSRDFTYSIAIFDTAMLVRIGGSARRRIAERTERLAQYRHRFSYYLGLRQTPFSTPAEVAAIELQAHEEGLYGRSGTLNTRKGQTEPVIESLPSLFRKSSRKIGTVAMLGGVAMAFLVQACLPANSQQPEQTPIPVTKVIETPVTPYLVERPETTPSTVASESLTFNDLSSYRADSYFDPESMRRNINFSFKSPSNDLVFVGFSVDGNSLALSSNDVTVALSPGQHTVSLTYTLDGQSFDVEGQLVVQGESVRAYNNRLESFVNNTLLANTVISEEQLPVLQEQIELFLESSGVATRGDAFESFADTFNQTLQPYLMQDAEEVKRAIIAANTLLASDTSATPTLDDVAFMLQMYDEHRTNNVKQVVDTVTGEINNVAFSDPTSFNSVFDMTVLLNYIATPEDAVDERTHWIFGDKFDAGGNRISFQPDVNTLIALDFLPYEGFDRQTLLKNDLNARTTAIALADILGFYALPETGLSAFPDWIELAPENARGPLRGYASRYDQRPFALNSRDRPELRSELPVPFAVDREKYENAVVTLYEGFSNRNANNENITYLQQVGGLIKYWAQHIDYIPTSTAPHLEALARGNLNETPLTPSFSVDSTRNITGVFRGKEVTLDFSKESIITIDDALARKDMIAALDVETRGFTLRTNALSFISNSATMDKEELFLWSKEDGLGTSGAFRALGAKNIHNGDLLYIYPEEQETLVYVGGRNYRISNNSLRANRESWGMLWLTPEGRAKAPPPITASTVANFGNNYGVTAGEPWVVPLGVQLPDVLPLSTGAPFTYPSLFPNADTAPVIQYPFVDVEQTARIIGDVGYGWNVQQKNFLTVVAALDEGLNKRPRYANDIRAQLRGPHELVFDNTHLIQEPNILIKKAAERVGLENYSLADGFTPYLDADTILQDAVDRYFPEFSESISQN